MKSILILSPHYHPETGAAARRITSMAEYLSNKSWKVTVITQAPHYPQNHVYEGYGKTFFDVRSASGIEIVRIKPWLVDKDNLILRVLAELHFCFFCLIYLVKLNANLVLASSPYMFLGPCGLIFSRLKRAKFLWDVRDLTWLYPKATGKKTYGLDYPIERLMLWTARNSDALITATEGLMTYFSKKPNKTMILPNGVSDDWLDQLLELKLPELTSLTPKAVYVGLLGFNHGLSTIIEVAGQLPNVDFFIVGDGPERSALENQVRALGLSNVIFTGYLGQENLLTIYDQATVLISHVRDNPLYKWTQPAKLWEYMATGRPIVHAGQGEMIDILNQNNLAVTTNPEQPELFAEAIKRLLSNYSQSINMAINARAYVSKYRRRSSSFDEFIQFISEFWH